MIKRIKYIKNLGLFSNWTAPSDLIFGPQNLIYGWNGSGKSTLSKLFRSLEKKQNNEQFSSLEFQIELEDTTVVDNTYSNNYPQIRVFNKEFIEENTKFERGATESIIYIGKSNKSLKSEIDEFKNTKQEYLNKETQVLALQKNYQAAKDSFFTNAGAELKAFFINTIFASVNYDKRNSIKIWDEIKGGASLNDFILNDFKFNHHKDFIAQGQQKGKIQFELNKFKADNNDELYKEVQSLIESNPVIKAIDRLTRHADIAEWVQNGLSIHQKNNSLSCEFCNQTLPEGKLNNIADHFNEDFQNLQKEIAKKKIEIEGLLIPKLEINPISFYSDKLRNIQHSVQLLNGYADIINEGIEGYLNLLKSKESNPLRTAFSTSNIGRGNISSYNAEVDRFMRIISAHNEDIENHAKLADEYRINIEKHFVAKKAADENFLNLIGSIAQKESEIKKVKDDITNLTNVIRQKELELQSDTIAIEEINLSLHLFLGRNEIKLEKNPSGGYLLKRNDELALNLSEGEKTAISLVYFIAKIKENDNNLKQTIIVLDDPISSLDSNHLFNAASFLKEEFFVNEIGSLKVLQLILLTHNFYFFSLMNEWLGEEKKIFCLNAINENGLRKSSIEMADNALTYFNSEYHLLFSEIKKYCESPDKTYFHTHTIANISRQVLESFLTFKYGRKKLDRCFNEITGFSDLTKVRKFVNHYSHRANHGESIKGFNDNVFAETNTLVPMVLKLIEHVDPIHYNSMINRLNNN